MEIRSEKIVNLTEELIDLKVRQAILAGDLTNSKSCAQIRLDGERMQTVKLRLVQALDSSN
jgi:hypothetical protein